MSVTTESKLRSKYDSSSKKIKQLYEQFSVMKNAMYTPSKKTTAINKFFPCTKMNDSELFNIQVNTSVNKGNKNKQGLYMNRPIILNSENQNYLLSTSMKSLSYIFVQINKKIDERVLLMQGKLKNIKLLCQQINIYEKMVKQKRKNEKSIKCKCRDTEIIIKQIQQRYDKKTTELINTYENKISLIVKQSHGQETSDSSNQKKIAKQLEDQLQQMQDKLIIKQQQITNLKINNSKLRKALDQHKVLIAEKQALIDELHREIDNKHGKVTETTKIKKVCNTCEQLKLEINKLKEDIGKLNSEKKEIQKQLHHKKTTYAKYPSLDTNKIDRKESEIQKECPIVMSDEDPDDHFQASQANVEEQQNFEPLRHTQYFYPALRKDNHKHQQKIKELECELQLLSAQNNLLKTKKDKFEQQCKQNEGDEQKFQLQCQILRDELKNVSVDLKMLDECAVSYLKEKRANEETVVKLSDSIKFKEQYFKKFPRKKIKSSNKM